MFVVQKRFSWIATSYIRSYHVRHVCGMLRRSLDHYLIVSGCTTFSQLVGLVLTTYLHERGVLRSLLDLFLMSSGVRKMY